MAPTWPLLLLAAAAVASDALSTPDGGLLTVIDSPSHKQLLAVPEGSSTVTTITKITEAEKELDPKQVEMRPQMSTIAENTTVNEETRLTSPEETAELANENITQASATEENGVQYGCPARCDCTQLPDGTSHNCSLPSGGVIMDEFGDGITFKCLSGQLRCSEIPLRGGAGSSVGAVSENATLRSVTLRGCALRDEPLLCALRRRGAVATRHLTLQAPRTPLGAQHVRGLATLSMLRITDGDGQEMELPLEVLSLLPELRQLAVDNARLVLHAALPALPLEALELADDALQSLPRAAFRRLPRLRRLGLWRNRLSELPEDALHGLEALQELSLSSNELRTLPGGLLAGAPRLRQLDLYDNALRSLPRAALSGLAQLQQVRLNDNRDNLTLEEGAFADLTSLEELELSRSGLRALPPGVLSGCRALRRLLLAGNALRDLPPRLLSGLPALRYLDLSRNQLRQLPPDFFVSQQNLTELFLDRNQFEELPRSLEVLSLNYNKLQHIASDAFLGVRSLLQLRLAHNLLTLSGQPRALRSAGRAASERYGQLAEPLSPFNSLLLLTHLDLSHNRVQRLFDDWRIVLVDLRKLNLSWNNISDLNYINMNFVSSDITVDLRHNNISTVRLWGPSGGSARFLLDENPFTCDCHLPPLQAALAANTRAGPQLLAQHARCASPHALRGEALSAAPRAQLFCVLPPPACPRSCRCYLHTDRLDLDCVALPELADLPAPAAHGVNVTHLRLRRMPDSLNALPRHVRTLTLTHLDIAELPRLPPAVEVDLVDNRLTRVPPEAFANNTLRLARNPLACDCSATADVAALQRASSNILDYDDVTCSGGEPVQLVVAERLCDARDAATLGVALALLAAIATAAALLVRRYRAECLLCAHRCGCCPPDDDDDSDKEYDAFISFAHKDLAFAEEMVSRLEGSARPLRVCVHYRDWPLGDWIPAQISRSVERSRRTVVILSAHFLSSVWGLLEFREAHLRALSEGRARVVIVLLGDVMSDARLNDELRAYLSTNTYLHRDDPWFWAKLTDALRRRSGPLAALRRAARKRPRAAQLAAPLFADKLVRSALDAKLTQDGEHCECRLHCALTMKFLT